MGPTLSLQLATRPATLPDRSVFPDMDYLRHAVFPTTTFTTPNTLTGAGGSVCGIHRRGHKT